VESAPLSSCALTAAARWLQRCFSAGAICANVDPTSPGRARWPVDDRLLAWFAGRRSPMIPYVPGRGKE